MIKKIMPNNTSLLRFKKLSVDNPYLLACLTTPAQRPRLLKFKTTKFLNEKS